MTSKTSRAGSLLRKIRFRLLGKEIRAIQEENNRLRAALANSDQPCAYCSRPREEWTRCEHGFPGCPRSDDAMGCPMISEAMSLQQRVEVLEAARPHWAMGYSSDSIAAQSTAAALSEIWRELGVSNQTQAMQRLREINGSAGIF